MKTRAEFLKATQWFDPAWYVRKRPGAEGAADPLFHYLEHGAREGLGPNPYLDGLQRSRSSLALKPASLGDPRSTLQAEIDLIAASGLFDAAYYLENNPDIAARCYDPLRHFCRYGWRQLRRPNPNFDVWWYWSTYLDPMREAINPLVHYALVGLPAGYAGCPPAYRPGAGHVPAGGAVRRICFLAGYDPDGLVDDYVVELARGLSRFADVYYLADCVMRDGQLERLDAYVAGRWAYRHGLYDFGSWSALATRHVGWNIVEQYDELLLVNDSNYLIGELEPVFSKMHARACDWWGLQATKGMFPTRHRTLNRFGQPIPMRQVRADLIDDYLEDCIYDFHVGSYFVAFRAPVLADAGFRRRLEAVCRQRSKQYIVRKYEMGLTQYLIGKQFLFATFIDDLHPLHPVFTNRQFDLIEQGFPLFKRMFLVTNHYDAPGLASWKDKLRAVAPESPVDMIDRNLQRVADHEKLKRSFAVTQDPTGQSLPPRLLDMPQFAEADANTPKFDHWWAFVADPSTGALPGDERAVFEAVRHEPAIRKTVLTRWRKLQLDGENVVVAPLRSPQGQHSLIHSRQVFAGTDPEGSLVFPVSPVLHNLVDCEAAGGTGSPDSAQADQAAGRRTPLPGMVRPRLDLVSCSYAQLPDDLRRESDGLQALCAGRCLVLLAVAPATDARAAHDRFPREEVAALHAWLRDHGFALGVREPGAGGPHDGYDLLRGPDTLDLSERRFSQLEVLFRHAAVLAADASDCLAVFAATGRPAIRFGDGGTAFGKNGSPRSGARPEPACGDLPALVAALDVALRPRMPASATCEPRSVVGAATAHASDVVEAVLRLYRPDQGDAACER